MYATLLLLLVSQAANLEIMEVKENEVVDSETCSDNEKWLGSEMCLERMDGDYPDYSYRRRVNFLYTKITGDRCKKYQCMLCNFETEYLYGIQKHFMRHSNIRPYSCQNCDYDTRIARDLKRHMLYGCGKPKFGSGGKYQCDFCEYSTSVKPYLERHLRCHSREKPFSCDQCEYRATQKGNLTKHKLTHTSREKTFPCEQCSCKYSAKSSLVFHVNTKHPKVYCFIVTESKIYFT